MNQWRRWYVSLKIAAPSDQGPQLDTYSLVSFVPLDVSDEKSIAHLLQHIDGAIQYGGM